MSIKRVLFVCVENSNRSQIAEAIARMHGGDGVEARAPVRGRRAALIRRRLTPCANWATT